MIYNDYVSADGKGIIKLLFQNQALSFLPAELIEPLDNAFTRQSGQKTFTDSIARSLATSNDLTSVSLELTSLYSTLWSFLYHSQPESFATEKTTVSDNGSIDTKNTVSGYDSDTMVDDTAINRTNTNNTTTTKTDYTMVATVMVQLQNNDLWRKITVDLNNYLFIALYN